MKQTIEAIVTVALFCCAACSTSSPFVGRVETEGAVFAGFDLSTFVGVADAAGRFTIAAKGSEVPVYAVSLDAGTVYVARFGDPEYKAQADIGSPLPLEAEPIVRELLTAEEIGRLGITFDQQE